jgi:hypothetical protein
MTTTRPLPFDLVFGELAAERFPALAESFEDIPPLDRFLMAGPVVELLHELRPAAGLGDAVDDFVAFVHAAYAHWTSGRHTRVLDAAATTALLDPAPIAAPGAALDASRVEYIQVAPRLVWSRLAGAEAHEPLDGWFALPDAGTLRLVACLGVHPSRPGLSVLTIEGPAPRILARDDGTPAFSPQMTGGDTAGLASVATPEELLAIGWRAAARGLQ